MPASFTNTVLATINHITLPATVTHENIAEFEKSFLDWLGLPVQVHVLDFKGVAKLHRSIYSPVAKFKRESESRQARLVSINLSIEMLKQLKSDGVDQMFGYMKTHSLADRAPSRDSMEEIRAWLIKYSVEAGRSAVNMMFDTTVAADENYRETPSNLGPEKFYKVAVIRGDARKFKAVFRLFFERTTLMALSKTVADATRTEVDEELLLSTATELLNIIYTSVKSKVNDERGYGLPAAIPALVDPSQLTHEKAVTGRGASWIPFVTPLGAYYLQIELGA